jgi:hypothetical protein
VSAPAARSGDGRALATALGQRGLSCEVQAREGLAVIMAAPSAVAELAAPTRRRDVLALAREHGFSHVAVELTTEPTGAGAPLLRD